MKGSVGNPFWEMDAKDEFESFVLDLLKIVETGDGSGVEGDAWVRGFHALGFWSFRATHDVLDSGRLSRSEGRRFLASPKS